MSGLSLAGLRKELVQRTILVFPIQTEVSMVFRKKTKIVMFDFHFL